MAAAKIAPSMLSSDLANLASEADLLHMDIMAADIPWMFPREEWQQVDKLNGHCSFNFIKTMSTVLMKKPDQELKFKESCFKEYFDFPDKNYLPTKLIHNILLRQIQHDDVEIELRFRLGDQTISYGPKEFCLVTGLKLGNLDPIWIEPSTSLNQGGIRTRYWSTVDRVTPDHIRPVFESLEYQEDDDCVKLALLLFVHYIILGQEKTTYIERWLFKLVDDLDRFNRFPWGHYAWRLHHFYLRRNFKHRNPASGKEFTYHLYGYSWAFAIWTMEVMPQMKKVLHATKPNEEFPRFRRWRFFNKATLVFEQFAKLERDDKLVVTPIAPTEEELVLPYLVDFEVPLTGGPGYKRPEYVKEGIDRGKRSRRAKELLEKKHKSPPPQPRQSPPPVMKKRKTGTRVAPPPSPSTSSSAPESSSAPPPPPAQSDTATPQRPEEFSATTQTPIVAMLREDIAKVMEGHHGETMSMLVALSKRIDTFEANMVKRIEKIEADVQTFLSRRKGKHCHHHKTSLSTPTFTPTTHISTPTTPTTPITVTINPTTSTPNTAIINLTTTTPTTATINPTTSTPTTAIINPTTTTPTTATINLTISTPTTVIINPTTTTPTTATTNLTISTPTTVIINPTTTTPTTATIPITTALVPITTANTIMLTTRTPNPSTVVDPDDDLILDPF